MVRTRFVALGAVLVVVVAVLFAAGFSPKAIPGGNNSTQSEGRTLSLTFLNRTLTTFSVNGSTASFTGLEYYTVQIASATQASGFVNITRIPQGVWAKLFPSQSVQVEPPSTNLTLAIAGGIEPSAGNPETSPLSVEVSFSDGSSVESRLMLVPVVGVSSTAGSSPIQFYTTPTIFSNSSVYVPYGAVYDPSSALAPIQLALSLQPIGLLVNGTTTALPSWLQLDFLNSSLLLQADNPSYSEIGFICSNAPPGTYNVAVLEHFPSNDFVTTVSLVVVPSIRA